MECKIKETVFDLIEKHSLDQLKAMKAEIDPVVWIMGVAIPGSEEAEKQKETMMLMSRCVNMAIAFVNDSNKNQC